MTTESFQKDTRILLLNSKGREQSSFPVWAGNDLMISSQLTPEAPELRSSE